jgi:act minimal PKS acyl carrier protein
MRTLRIEDLTRIMRECAGEDEAVDLNGDILHTPLEELGYDSLALLETTSRIEREYQVSLPEEMVADFRTPADMLKVVNACLSGT